MYKEQQHHMVTGFGVTALFIKGWTYARQGFFFRRFYIEMIIAVGKFGQFFKMCIRDRTLSLRYPNNDTEELSIPTCSIPLTINLSVCLLYTSRCVSETVITLFVVAIVSFDWTYKFFS